MNVGDLVGGLIFAVVAIGAAYMALHPDKDPFYDAFSDQVVRFFTFGGTRSDWHVRFRVGYVGLAVIALVAAIALLLHV